MDNPYSIFTEIKKYFLKKRNQKLLQCYNWLKPLISLNNRLLQKCYRLLQGVTKVSQRARVFNVFIINNYSRKKSYDKI
tara:strand:+ start:269 stop:505 length:237 start_codon:yes stop_codon:yes gene_type:complete